MVKPIQVVYTQEASIFIKGLDVKFQKQFLLVVDKIQMGIKDNEIFKKLDSTDGIREFCFKDYRMLAFWDGRGNEATLIVCTHGFQKKRSKVPKKEIEKAEQIRKEHFDN